MPLGPLQRCRLMEVPSRPESQVGRDGVLAFGRGDDVHRQAADISANAHGLDSSADRKLALYQQRSRNEHER